MAGEADSEVGPGTQGSEALRNSSLSTLNPKKPKDGAREEAIWPRRTIERAKATAKGLHESLLAVLDTLMEGCVEKVLQASKHAEVGRGESVNVKISQTAANVVDAELKPYVGPLVEKCVCMLWTQPAKLPYLKLLQRLCQVIIGPEVLWATWN